MIRERVLEAAVAGFAASGFHGVSIRDLARTIGVSAPALLHHFPSKERLYSAVLDRIRESIEPFAARADCGDPVEQVVAMVDDLIDWTRDNDAYSRIILRELLDNAGRAERARKWHLKSVVAALSERVERAGRAAKLDGLDAELFVFEIVGAVAYFHAGLPTISRVTGRASPAALASAFRAELVAATRARLAPARRSR